MCNVAELKKAKQRIAELEQEIVVSPPPIERGKISYKDLYQLLSEKFEHASVYLSDSDRSLCDIEDIDIFLDQDKTNHEIYVSQEYDCDDFTYRLMGQFSIPGWAKFSKGILWTSTHAQMCFVDANLDIWIIEPQTDGYSKLEEPMSARIIMM